MYCPRLYYQSLSCFQIKMRDFCNFRDCDNYEQKILRDGAVMRGSITISTHCSKWDHSFEDFSPNDQNEANFDSRLESTPG